MNITLNLLPPRKREELKNLSAIGAISKVGIAALASILLFVVFVEFSVMAISVQQKAFESEMTRFERDSSYVSAKEAQDSLRDYDVMAKQVKRSLLSQKNYWGIISEVNQVIPEGIYLNNFSIESDVVALRGVALERESFLVLKKQLEENEIFSKVDSPISNIVSEKNTKFEIKATLKDEKEE